MKNFYETLGVSQGATETEVKKAYRKLALIFHTDRGGDGEKMRSLNEAYEILSDSAKKYDFDERWRAYQEADIDTASNVVIDGYLQAGKTLAYSHVFKMQHKAFIEKYTKMPLQKNVIQEKLQPFKTDIYHLKTNSIADSRYHDIFTFIQAAADIKKPVK